MQNIACFQAGMQARTGGAKWKNNRFIQSVGDVLMLWSSFWELATLKRPGPAYILHSMPTIKHWLEIMLYVNNKGIDWLWIEQNPPVKLRWLRPRNWQYPSRWHSRGLNKSKNTKSGYEMELQWMEGIDFKFLTKLLQGLQGLTQWCFGYEKACSNNNVAQQ